MSEITDRLRTDHINITRLLDQLDKQLEALRRDQATDYRLMHEIVRYFVSYPDAMHHPLEDILFERIKERDAAVGQRVSDLQRQHREQAAQGRDLETLLAGVAAGQMVPRQRLIELTASFIELQRAHMKSEEQDLFPVAEDLLTAADWSVIAEASSKQDDPLFGARVDAAYQQVYDSIRREE